MLITERLKLIPLTADELRLCIDNRAHMETKLGLTVTGTNLSSIMRNIYEVKIDNIVKDEDNYLYYTYWQIVLIDKNYIIGEIGFKDIPNSWGEIEVGYGLEEEYRGNGYMMEALSELVGWAFNQQGIDAVIAITNRDNIASQRTLIKSGFNVQGEDYKYIYWRIENYNTGF